MTFNNTNIVFLQDTDFDIPRKILKTPLKTFVMVQGSFCGHCISAKPAFIEAANQNTGDVIFATIQVDGDASEKALAKQLGKITNGAYTGGVPTYLLFENGKYKTTYNDGRDAESISNFTNSL